MQTTVEPPLRHQSRTPSGEWPTREWPSGEWRIRPSGSAPLRVQWINGALLVRSTKAESAGEAHVVPLTQREHQVLALVAEGNSNKRVGDQLGITERTVKSHLTGIMAKLCAFDRTHAVVQAIRLGWLAI